MIFLIILIETIGWPWYSLVYQDAKMIIITLEGLK
jgi:hypothetical protein